MAPGEASDKLASALEGAGNVHLIRAPFVAQEDFDQFLWASDAVIVRGEDSFVRAQLAGTPLLWSIYPTEDMAHEIKLNAWLDRFITMYEPNEEVAKNAFVKCAESWVKGTLTSLIFQTWLTSLNNQCNSSQAWKKILLKNGDLTKNIAAYI